MNHQLLRLLPSPCLGMLVFNAALAVPSEAQAPQYVKQLDIIHFSHTDYGFTDHPAVCRELQQRYLDLALDTALSTRGLPEEARFRWTAETTVAVDDWWQAATPAPPNRSRWPKPA